MIDPYALRIYKVFLSPARSTANTVEVTIGAFDTGMQRGRVDFLNRKSLELVMHELEHPLGVAEPLVRDIAQRLGRGESVSFDLPTTHRKMQEAGYISPVDFD